MKRSTRIDVTNKTIEVDSVISLISVFKSKGSDKDHLTLTFKDQSGADYEFSEDETIRLGIAGRVRTLLKNHNIISCEFRFRSSDYNTRLDADLCHANKYGTNGFLVESDNKTWFSATRAEIDDWIQRLNYPQSGVWLSTRKFLPWLIVPIVSMLFIVLFIFFNTDPNKDTGEIVKNIVTLSSIGDFIATMILTVLAFSVGRSVSRLILRRIDDYLWASVEFNFSSNKNINVFGRRRHRLGQFFKSCWKLIVIPLIVVVLGALLLQLIL